MDDQPFRLGDHERRADKKQNIAQPLQISVRYTRGNRLPVGNSNRAIEFCHRFSYLGDIFFYWDRHSQGVRNTFGRCHSRKSSLGATFICSTYDRLGHCFKPFEHGGQIYVFDYGAHRTDLSLVRDRHYSCQRHSGGKICFLPPCARRILLGLLGRCSSARSLTVSILGFKNLPFCVGLAFSSMRYRGCFRIFPSLEFCCKICRLAPNFMAAILFAVLTKTFEFATRDNNLMHATAGLA